MEVHPDLDIQLAESWYGQGYNLSIQPEMTAYGPVVDVSVTSVEGQFLEVSTGDGVEMLTIEWPDHIYIQTDKDSVYPTRNIIMEDLGGGITRNLGFTPDDGGECYSADFCGEGSPYFWWPHQCVCGSEDYHMEQYGQCLISGYGPEGYVYYGGGNPIAGDANE